MLTMYFITTQNMSVHTSAPDRRSAVAGDGGWSEQPNGGQCRSDGVITTENQTHKEDWGAAQLNTAWLRDKSMSGATHAQPFYVYQGMNIVHPPYLTTQHWYDKIGDNLSVPEWQPLDQMHPCGLQSAMLKGCIPTAAEAEDFYSLKRRRNVRRVYLAMIAEFDAMVGEYVHAVDDAGLTERTIFIVTSDHGDMDMEQQQFYKMVPYEASTRVPLVISGKGIVQGRTFLQATSLIDLYPTLLEYGKASVPAGHDIDGHSLVPLLSGKAGSHDTQRPQYVGWHSWCARIRLLATNTLHLPSQVRGVAGAHGGQRHFVVRATAGRLEDHCLRHGQGERASALQHQRGPDGAP
jgi:arylsulfatase A-like enzyme